MRDWSLLDRTTDFPYPFGPTIDRAVSQNLFVSVPDVRRRIRVIDRGCDVELVGHGRDDVTDSCIERNSAL